MRCQIEWMIFAMGLAGVAGQPGGGIYGPIPCQFTHELRAKKQAKAIELLLEELPQLNLEINPKHKKIHKRIDVPPSIPNATSSSPIPEAPPMPPVPVTTLPPPPPPPAPVTTLPPAPPTTTQQAESRVIRHEKPKSVCARSMAVGVVGYSILCEKRKAQAAAAAAAAATAATTTTTTTTTTTPAPPPPPPTTFAPIARSLLDPNLRPENMSKQEVARLSKQLESLMRCGNFRCRQIDESVESMSD